VGLATWLAKVGCDGLFVGPHFTHFRSVPACMQPMLCMLGNGAMADMLFVSFLGVLLRNSFRV